MKSRTISLILPLLSSLSLAALAQGGDKPLWEIEKAGFNLAIHEDTIDNGWGKIKGTGLHLKYSNGKVSSSSYPQFMGSIAGVIQEGLALQSNWEVPYRDLGQPRIAFLASGDVELQFDKDDPTTVIVLTRKEALEFVAAIQGHFQKAIEKQKQEEATRSDDKDSQDPKAIKKQK